MGDQGGGRGCSSSSTFPVQVEHLFNKKKVEHLHIVIGSLFICLCMGHGVYLIKKICDSLIIITASPGFIVRASRKPGRLRLIKLAKQEQKAKKRNSFYLASLFTGAPQVVYRSVIILGGINCNNNNGEVSERFSCCLFVFVFLL